MSRGWHNEPQRHSMAARGINTKSYVEPLRARSPKYPKMIYSNQVLTPENMKTIMEYVRATNNEVEWICDVDLKEDGTIRIEDGQLDGSADESFLSWDPDDPKLNIGYFHSHPRGVFNWFSSTDFILAIKVHNLRIKENKERFPWTFMGLVSENDEGKFTLQLVAIKPEPGREKQFQGLEKEYITDLEGTHEKVLQLERGMANKGELIRFPEIEL